MEPLEKELNEKLIKEGLNLGKRLVFRTIVFNRPKLYPSSWGDDRWQSFEHKNFKQINQMKEFVLKNSIDTDLFE